jgi:two-component system, chemotaxis family, chemotaxis protein CheY
MTVSDYKYHKVRIMLVDDDSLSRGYLRTALSNISANVVAELSRGNDAVEHFAKCNPDVVFLDINLPDMDGHQVLAKLLLLQPDAFVVMVSAHNSFDNVKNALDNGAKGFIVKPFSTQKIIATIDRYLASGIKPRAAL